MPLIYIILMLGVILLLYYFYAQRNEGKYLVNIPSPPSNFLFGILMDFLNLTPEKYLEKALDLTRYGRLVKLKTSLFSEGVLVTDEKFTNFILTSSKHIQKSDEYLYFQNWLGSGLLLSTGNIWKRHRHLITPAFHSSMLEQYFKVFEKCSETLTKLLTSEVGKKSVNITNYLTLFSLDVLLESAMGTTIDVQNNVDCDYVQMTKLMLRTIAERTFSLIPNLLYPFHPLYQREQFAIKMLRPYVDNVIESKLKKIENKKVNDNAPRNKRKAFIDSLLQNYFDGQINLQEIHDEVQTFLVAGYDTSACTIGYMLYCLANNPEIQEKVIEEQQQIFKGSQNVTNTIEKLNEMKYLDLVIKETLRMYCTVPVIGRKLTEDCEYNGILFPKGLSLYIFTYAMHRDPKYFSEPEKFIPERFLQGREKTSAFFAFGAGPRNCIGQKFAKLELKSCISQFIRKFEVFPAEPNPPLILLPESALHSKDGIKISLKHRRIFQS